jgi:hypothetical protein
MSLVSNEQVKLTATFLNAIASALVIVGGVTPLAAWAFAIPSAPGRSGQTLILITTAFVGTGFGIHWLARQLLRRLT